MASPTYLNPAGIHVPVGQVTVDCGVYLDGRRLPGRYPHLAARAKVGELASEDGKAFVWIWLHEPDKRQMHNVAVVFGLHPLAVHGAVRNHYRPKIQRFDDTLLLVLKTVDHVEHQGMRHIRHFVETGEVMVVVGGKRRRRTAIQHLLADADGRHRAACPGRRARCSHRRDAFDTDRGGAGKIALQQNTDMRKISAWVALAAVPTLVAAIYGMNFPNLPLEDWTWGYPVVMAATSCVCVLLYVNFRRNRWL